jgi:hypothetical protein
MGRLYEKEDVIKAVEAVERGLLLMQGELRKQPQHVPLRMYYAITLANLPVIFKRKEEALDSLNSLVKESLTDSQNKLVFDAITLAKNK